MRILYRPLPAIWPTGKRTMAAQRLHSRFRASWADTLELLERELKHLGVRGNDVVTIEAGYQEHEIRLDGAPRRGARPNDPAIIVSFQSKYGPLRYGCDRFHNHDANLRAIALTLENLRAVDRYGVTKRGEQYQGWSALPPSGDGEMNRDEAREFILHHSGLRGVVEITAAYRAAAKRLHPDTGGSDEGFRKLERAKQVIGF